MMTRLAISGYRSLRDVRVTLGALNVVTGANGSGKSSLYRALKLLADIAQGRIIQSLAAEGGLQSTLWAGPEAFSRAMKAGTQPVQGVVRKNAISLKLGFSGDDYGYAIDLGLPTSGIFPNDPAIKVESLWTGERLGRANAFAVRTGPFVRIRNDNGEWREAYQHLAPFDSMMTHCSDPREALELLLLRERMRDWRFYDHLRTDRDAPSRKPQVGTYTPVLASDGSDLAAAVATIRETGDGQHLNAAIADAFPGARIDVSGADGYCELEMHQHGLLRPLKAAELSDGTLRYLSAGRSIALAAAAGADDPQRTRDELASRFAATAGAPDRASIEALAGRGGVTCRGAGFRARGSRRLCADRPGEGAWRNRRQEPHAAPMDLAFAVIDRRAR